MGLLPSGGTCARGRHGQLHRPSRILFSPFPNSLFFGLYLTLLLCIELHPAVGLFLNEPSSPQLPWLALSSTHPNQRQQCPTISLLLVVQPQGHHPFRPQSEWSPPVCPQRPRQTTFYVQHPSCPRRAPSPSPLPGSLLVNGSSSPQDTKARHLGITLRSLSSQPLTTFPKDLFILPPYYFFTSLVHVTSFY